jgi:hypothetical protein
MSGGLFSCVVLFAAASFASNLKDVRVGPHGEYTRVVLETDTKTSYSLNQSAAAVTIELQASAAPKAVTAKSQQLSWVRVEPQGASTLVRIELKGPARVKQMVLTGPNRIVLDLYGDGAASTRPAPAPIPEPAVTAERVAEPTPAPIAAESPATSPRIDDEAALVKKEADALLGPETSPIPGDELAATEGVPAEEASPAEGLASEGTELATPQPAAPPPVTKQARHQKKSLVDWLQDPYILGGLAIMMLALVVILRRRRPAVPPAEVRAEDESSAASLFAQPQAPPAEAGGEVSAEAAGSFAPGAGDEPSAEEAVAEPDTDVEGASSFDFEAPDVEPEKPDIGRARGATLSTIGAVTSTAAYETNAPTATGGLSLAELERRMSLLEQRLEEVIDAKDRLERQVSAQTEELRVQRAAIARTQRVLRTVVRPEDDQPSEPALKS